MNTLGLFFTVVVVQPMLSISFAGDISEANKVKQSQKGDNPSPTAQVGTEAKFFYFENVPKHKLSLVFAITKFCNLKQSALGIKEFDSEKKYPAIAEKGDKKTPVRIVNLYATYNKFCKLEPNENFDQKFPIPESNLMTHIYVTVDPDIDVRSIQ